MLEAIQKLSADIIYMAKKSEVEIGVESDGTVLASPIYQELYAAHFSRPSSYNPATYKFPVLESLRPVVELDQNVPLL